MDLKAPFPYFGGKRAVALKVWARLGNPANYLEPFAGSLAVLLLRPDPPKIETVNDADHYLANFWRSMRHDPEAVAHWCNEPVHEVELRARHKWLVMSTTAKEWHDLMEVNPDHYNAKIAGWWVWGISCWIGSGWCKCSANTNSQLPDLAGLHGASGRGVHSGANGCNLPSKRPIAERGRGTHTNHEAETGPGIWTAPNGRPQLANAYDVGCGVHSNRRAGTCKERLEWLIEWFHRLQDRLRLVRVCCGDWARICSSDSTTTRLGTTGVFLDPPYGAAADRTENLYSVDSLTVAADVTRWCLEWGNNPDMRIVLAGYAGEGHEALEAEGWTIEKWKANGGYGNRSAKGKANAAKERLWISPHCLTEPTLFDFTNTEEEELANG